MRTIILFLTLFSGILKTSAETYTSQFSDYVNATGMWKKSDGTIVTLGNNTEFRNPANTFNVNHALNLVTFLDGDTGSEIVINSGGSLNILSGGNLRNSIVTVKNGGSLFVDGNYYTSGTSTINGNISVKGSMTVKTGTNLSIGNSIQNINTTVEVNANLSITGSLNRDNDKIFSFTNNGSAIISGEIQATNINNTGTLSVSNIGNAGNNTLTLNNSATGIINVTTAQDFSGNKREINNIGGTINFNSTLKQNNSNNNITNTGKINIASTFTYNDGAFNNNLGGEVTIGTNFDISTNNTLKNYGKIVANGALTYNYGGALYNYSGANILIKGTGSLLNSNSYLYNSGSITFNQNLDIRNAIIKNYIPGSNVEVITNPQGYIAAKSGITLQNSGCVKGGSVDYWGTISGGNGTCTFSNVKLPIELLSFRGNIENRGVVLIWITESETNNNYFQIEVSTDGRNYSILGTIDGAGNSSTELQYELLDKQPSNGVNYYRLSQTDFDGQKRYFAPIAVHYSNIEALIYPTVIHADDIVNVQLSSITEEVPFQIISQDGKILTAGSISNDAELPSDWFQFGLNQLIIGSDNNIIKTSIVKQ